MSPSAVVDVLAAGEAFAHALAALAPGDLPEASLTELLRSLDPVANRIDAARTDLLGVWDARLAWAGEGARSGASWVASHTEQARGAAAAQIRLARSLRTMPVVEAACASGVLGQAKARLLAQAADDNPEAFRASEEFLVRQATGLRVDEVAKVLDHWRAHVDPDGSADQAAKDHADRQVHLSKSFQGQWVLDGRLTEEAGELLRNELDRRGRARYRSEKALADANGLPMQSTAAQRRADALIEMALQAMAAGDDGNSVNTPSLTAIIRVDELARPEVLPTDVVGETELGAPVTAAAAQRWTCDCAISRVVMGPDSVPVDLGMTARLPSPAQRRALAVRDRGCVFPGCDAHAGWTSAHHLVHWIHDGPTDLENLALLCNFHHHRVHEGGFGVRRLPAGSLEFTKPDGRPLEVPKGRAPDPSFPSPADHRHLPEGAPHGRAPGHAP